MAEGNKESHVEDHIARYLLSVAEPEFPEYTLKTNEVYDKELCMIPEDLVGFIKDTQPEKYKALTEQYGAATDDRIAKLVADTINKAKGKTIEVLRNKLRDRGQYIDLIYFKPQHNRTPEHLAAYKMNRLTIIRQLKYSTRNQKSIDLVLFVNGLPVITIELKNALTGQHLHHAIRQYIVDRDPKEPLLEFKRCLVHFAVSTEQVSMTTELKGKQTRFLPFNKALVNEDAEDYATSYLWKDVLRKDSLMDLLQNYINLQKITDKYYDPATKTLKEKSSTRVIFPRYHQRRAVRNLLHAVRADGVGNKYLIQHSAGSGKSNTISWLAHRLSDLYRNPEDEKAMFDGVIVVTDRRVLDKQIQQNIQQFDHSPGSVAYIDENKTSKDLKEAIEAGYRVIVTTLQKFPVISDAVAQNHDKNYAVIIDEAHSSQSGESARHLRKALSLEEAESSDIKEKDIDEIIEEEIKRKGAQKNISFFAFTATPKSKTIELFGTERDGRKEPFDLYCMEQAIKEGFILDVLKTYMSWKRYYKLNKRSEIEDKEYEKKKTVRLLSNYVDLQDHAIEKKTRVMLEHFASKTQNEIQGNARAMLVTRSRLHAVRYKRKFDEVMQEMNLPYGALVAFSGTVTDKETGQDYTKENMNNLGGKISIPEALKLPQYRILIVANMYQTGFDEPMLHTMFVDKKLGNVNTVQTLSRLNRTMAGKDNTMVLDFVNEPEEIQQDFQEYYGSIFMNLEDETDPNSLYVVLGKIESAHIIYPNDLDAFAKLFFTKGDHMEQLQPILNEMVKRYKEQLNDDERLNLKAAIKDYIRLYRFLSQIITFADIQLEKYYVLLVNLYKKLPIEATSLPTEVLEEINLDSYKLQHKYTTSLELNPADSSKEGMQPGGQISIEPDETEWLTKIVKVLNDTYGLDLGPDDKVELEKVKDKIYGNDELMSFFNIRNSRDNIRDKFNDVVDSELLNIINTKLDFYNKLTEDKANAMFKQMWFNEIYDRMVRGM